MIDKLGKAFTKLLAEVKDLRADVRNLPTPKDGAPGTPGVSPEPEAIAEIVLAQIPTPKDGEAGKDADINAVIEEVLAQIPTPKDGKPGRDAQPPLLADVAALVLAKMPKPKDGVSPAAEDVAKLIPKPKDGKDGVSPDPKAVAALVPVPAAKQGKPGKDGKSVTGVTLERNTLSVWIDGVKNRAGKIDLSELHRSAPAPAGGGGGTTTIPTGNALIDYDYFPGKKARQNTIVHDSGLLMGAIRDTTKRAAFQPEGDSFFLYAGTPVLDNVTAKQVIFGQRYKFIEQGGYLGGYKIKTVAGNSYQIYSVSDPEGVAESTLVRSFTATTTGEREYGLNPRFVPKGTSADVLAIVTEPDPTPTTFSGDWQYLTPNNETAPLNGQVVQADKALAFLDISKTDSAATDRSAELGALDVGDRIEMGTFTWSIQAKPDDRGSYYRIAVAPAAQAQASGVITFTFSTTTSTPITYERDDGYWAGTPAVKGIFGADVDYKDIVPDDNAYGIIDVQVQNASGSEDWAYLAGALSTAPGDAGVESQGGGTLDHLKYNEATNQLEADVTIKTEVDFTFNNWKLGTSDSSPCFVNKATGAASYPLTEGFKPHSDPANRGATGIVEATIPRVEENTQTFFPSGENPAPSGAVTYQRAATSTIDAILFGLEVVLAENITTSDVLVYRQHEGADDSGEVVINQELPPQAIPAGGALEWWLEKPPRGTTGDQRYVQLLVAPNGDMAATRPALVRPSLTIPANHWIKVTIRTYENEIVGIKNREFEMVSENNIPVSNNSALPTYVSGFTLDPSSSDDFELITSATGRQWIKNISDKTFDMSGDSFWQVSQGAGGTTELVLWSERSADDGATVVENPKSLRKREINNNNDDSISFPSSIKNFLPGESVSWAMFSKGGGSIALTPPSETVNGGNTVTGLSVYWQLVEIQ